MSIFREPGFPVTRMRRLRRTPQLRTLVRETELATSDFVYPLFVVEGENVRREIASMPGQFQLSIDQLPKECDELRQLQIPAVLLFGIPTEKDDVGSRAYASDGVIPRAIAAIKRHSPDLIVITDVCLCEYTSHGHCGVIESGRVANDKTLELLVREALSHAEAGADIIAPSDMMDGRVAAIRRALDGRGLTDVPIMSYSAKYSSSFYGPFREAAESAPQFGDRKAYQMDFGNSDEAMREIALDVAEGADIVMVKPALAYLDVIAKAKQSFNLPLAAYNVSGEYSMIMAAAANGWLDGEKTMIEVLTAIKRAGADIIITYFARDASRALTGQATGFSRAT